MNRKHYIYEMPPIDHWDGWIRAEDALDDPHNFGIVTPEASELEEYEIEGKSTTYLRSRLDNARFLMAKHTSWEGDGDFYISTMPAETSSELVFAVKQSNNGTTFILAPFEYAHLRDSLVAEVDVKQTAPAQQDF